MFWSNTTDTENLENLHKEYFDNQGVVGRAAISGGETTTSTNKGANTSGFGSGTSGVSGGSGAGNCIKA